MPRSIRIDKTDSETAFRAALAKEPKGLGVTRTNLQRLLKAIDLVGWDRHQESGRIDRRAFARFAAGGADIFARRGYEEGEKSAVSVLVDCSGSMFEAGRIEIATEVTIHLSALLSKTGVSYAVTGFDGSYGIPHSTDLGEVEEQTPQFYRVKTWNETQQRAAAKLGAIPAIVSQSGGGTPDYSALVLQLNELSRRPEHRKVLIVVTDATKYQPDHIVYVQELAAKLGITIVAIGIGTRNIGVFKHGVSIDDINGLASAAFNTLLKAIKK
jgi:cobalamin biosynthesis protein CobT